MQDLPPNFPFILQTHTGEQSLPVQGTNVNHLWLVDILFDTDSAD